MKSFSNTYIFIFASVMVIVVAALLSTAAMYLKPFQDRNIEIEKKSNILASIGVVSDADNAEKLYDEYIVDSYLVDHLGEHIEGIDPFYVDIRSELRKAPDQRSLPVFIGQRQDGSRNYILPLHGRGLWGPIWGYIALGDDLNTITGAYFTHAKETPGLGAEIGDSEFQKQFEGKQLFDSQNEFISVKVMKGGVDPENKHAVDAVSGGTITSNGVEEMLSDNLGNYVNFFKAIKNE